MNQTELTEQIERLVRAHLETTRRSVAAAVERALSPSSSKRSRPSPTAATRRSGGGRRSRAELAELGERLHETVCAQPGETMSVLAPALGKTPAELHLPMKALRRTGRVRSVGQRHQTRYYPTATGRS